MSETLQALEEYAEVRFAPRIERVAREETAGPAAEASVEGRVAPRLSADTRPADGAAPTPPIRLVVVVSREDIEARAELIRKQFTDGLSPAEARRLRYLEWQVETAVASEMAPDLLRLERVLAHFEDAASKVQQAAGVWRDRYPSAFPGE